MSPNACPIAFLSQRDANHAAHGPRPGVRTKVVPTPSPGDCDHLSVVLVVHAVLAFVARVSTMATTGKRCPAVVAYRTRDVPGLLAAFAAVVVLRAHCVSGAGVGSQGRRV